MSESGDADWQDDVSIPEFVLVAAEDPRVIAELAGIFRRNCRDSGGNRRPFGPGDAEALAGTAIERLLHPDTFRLADVGGLRLHLEIASEVYPGDTRIHVTAWDDDAEVWRAVGQVTLSTVGPPVDPS